MSEDRRENDKIILDRLDKIQEDVTQTKINLALNTQATQNTEDQLTKLNGKVVAHQASIQALQAQATLASTFIADTKSAKEKEEEKQEKKNEGRSATISRAYWLLIGIGMTLLGRIITYLEQNDFFKNIIK